MSTQLPLTPLTLDQRASENLGSGAEQADNTVETDRFLEDYSVTTGGVLSREHYELREGSQIVL